MRGAPFSKYEGTGNDFVVIEVARVEDFDAKAVPALCDRRLGVGADGVLLVLPPKEGSAAARMLVLNADGSVPEMCGNGLRCVALHLALARGGADVEVLVETDSGTRACSVRGAGAREARVRVDMGVVKVVERGRLLLGGEALDVAVVDAGNPHAVVFRDDPRADLPFLGPEIAQHTSFPAGTNVELVAQRGEAFDVFVWERGVGPTRACGTGACAVVAEAFASGLVKVAGPVTVHLPGGPLIVSHDAVTRRTELDGPARLVFRGELDGALLTGLRAEA
jgi:diaminopimelate epimerase